MEEGPARQHAHAGAHPGGRWFEQIVLGAIVLNTAVLVWSFLDEDHEQLMELIHATFLIFFVGEMMVRLSDVGWSPNRFFRASRWNLFDFIVVMLALLPVLGLDAGILRVARAARIIHSLRHIPHLRLLVRLNIVVRKAIWLLRSR